MNWITFIIAAFIAYVLDTGLRGLLALPQPDGGVSPSFLLVLMVYVGMLAPVSSVVWASLVCGALVDLRGGPVGEPILGPSSLGFLLGGYAVIQLRSLVFRESVATLAVMTFVAGILVQLATVMLYQVRNFGITPAESIGGWSAADALVRSFFLLLYSAAAAVPAGWLLFRLMGAFGFHHHHKPRDRF